MEEKRHPLFLLIYEILLQYIEYPCAVDIYTDKLDISPIFCSHNNVIGYCSMEKGIK